MAEDKKDSVGGIPSIYWKYIAAFFLVSVVIFVWNSFFNIGPPSRYTINYSQFMEQLDAGNIKSVSIKKLLISGELAKEVSIQLPGEKKPPQVKYFETVLPTFQGEGLLPQLKGKNVVITVESAEQGYFWQILIGGPAMGADHRVLGHDDEEESADSGWAGRALYVWCKQGQTV